MFNNCSSLTSLDLSNFITTEVTSMENMFYSCKGLTQLDISSFSNSRCRNFRNIFGECNGLTVFINNETLSNIFNDIPDYIIVKNRTS